MGAATASSAKPVPAASSRLAVASRIAAAVLGGYAFARGLVAASTSLLVASGVVFHDAEFLSSLLGVLGYLGALLWAIAARRLWPVWLVLLGGGAAMAGLASLVQAALI